ncbi:hypothetical protein CsSME_00014630 [Camellia sinensis var. sinensis]
MFSSYHAAEDGEQLNMRNSSTSKVEGQRNVVCATCTRYLKELDLWIFVEQEWV